MNVDVAKLGSLKHQLGPQTKLFNWNIITFELEVLLFCLPFVENGSKN